MSDYANSRKFLDEITAEAYNDKIREPALKLWAKHLDPTNPQWKYVSFKPFSVETKDGKAHVAAMTDKRLPGIGIVGYFASTDIGCGVLALDKAVKYFESQTNITDIYGPINGTLPNDYRINLSDDYVFPGEPINPDWYLETFKLAGFEVFNQYVSAISKHYSLFTKLYIRLPAKQVAADFQTRAFGTKDPESDFLTYHEIRNAIFPHQSVYCPAISLAERKYNLGKPAPYFDPKYTYFLEKAGRAVGFIMAYPYENDLVIKTLGVLPEFRGKRLSGILIHRVHDEAKADGLAAAIYAMIRMGNSVSRMKHPGVKVFRRYVTMHRAVRQNSSTEDV